MKRISITRTITAPAFALLAAGCGASMSAGTAAAGTAPTTLGTPAESRVSLIEEAPAPEGFLTVAVKYVPFLKDGQKPVMSDAEYGDLTRGMNKVMAQCKIRFRMEAVDPIDPAKDGLAYNTTSMEELDKIRAPFQDPARLVVINTGSWDHDNMGTANAWTAMPGSTPYGAVIEAPVASFANIVAHELGHYMGLDHVDDTSNLMNPIIYDDSSHLDPGQCSTMQETARGLWAQSLR